MPCWRASAVRRGAAGRRGRRRAAEGVGAVRHPRRDAAWPLAPPYPWPPPRGPWRTGGRLLPGPPGKAGGPRGARCVGRRVRGRSPPHRVPAPLGRPAPVHPRCADPLAWPGYATPRRRPAASRGLQASILDEDQSVPWSESKSGAGRSALPPGHDSWAPPTAVRAGGSATPKRALTHRRTSSTRNPSARHGSMRGGAPGQGLRHDPSGSRRAGGAVIPNRHPASPAHGRSDGWPVRPAGTQRELMLEPDRSSGAALPRPRRGRSAEEGGVVGGSGAPPGTGARRPGGFGTPGPSAGAPARGGARTVLS